MLKKLSYFLFFLIGLFNGYDMLAQTITLRDSVTQKPIPFVTVNTQKEIFYTDEKGSFPSSRLEKINTIDFSCIGYKTKSIKPKSILDTLFLSPQEYQLEEVTISADPPDPIEIGYHKLGNFTFQGTYGSTVENSIIAVYIPSNNKNGIITDIILSLKHLQKGSQFKVHLFKANQDGTPSDLILSKSIDVQKKRKYYYADISEFNQTLPSSGIYVGFEFILKDSTENQLKVKTTIELDSKLTYFFHQNVWFIMKQYPQFITTPKFGLVIQPY